MSDSTSSEHTGQGCRWVVKGVAMPGSGITFSVVYQCSECGAAKKETFGREDGVFYDGW